MAARVSFGALLILALLVCLGLYPGEPSSDYLFQKHEAFDALSTWHPIFMAVVFRMLALLQVDNIELVMFCVQIFIFYAALYAALFAAGVRGWWLLFSILLAVSFYPFWFFLKTLWKDVFFVAFYLFACAALLLMKGRASSPVLVGFLILAALAQLTRHNSVLALSLGLVLTIAYWWESGFTEKLVKGGALVFAFIVFCFGANAGVERLVGAKSPGSMTNFVAAFDSTGSFSKVDPSRQAELVVGLDPGFVSRLERGAMLYRHSDPSDMLYWGPAPALFIQQELASTEHVQFVARLARYEPLAVLDFKADIFMQLMGFTRYDFQWSTPSQMKGFLSSALEYLLPQVLASRTNIYGDVGMANLPIYLFGGVFITSLLMLLLFIANPGSLLLPNALAWVLFGLASAAPYLILTPGVFYRYLAAAHACLFVAAVACLIGFCREVCARVTGARETAAPD